MTFRVIPALLICALTAASILAQPAPPLETVLARIDRASAGFKSVTADIRRLTHTDVINDDTIDNGSMKLKRSKARDMRMLIDLSQPDPKAVSVQGKKAEIYYPRMQT